MSKLFCSNSSCAKLTNYDGMKPKFCSHCGQPFDAAFKSQAFVEKPVARQQENRPRITPSRPALSPIHGFSRQKYNEYGEPIENEEYQVPDTFEIKASIKGEFKKMKMGDLANMPVDNFGDRPKGNNFDASQIFAEQRKNATKGNFSDVDGE